MEAQIDRVKMYTRFIQYIAINGCRSIRCKGCLLSGICDRTPANGKAIAEQWLKDSVKMAEEKKSPTQEKKE
jgi:hypothetical protein